MHRFLLILTLTFAVALPAFAQNACAIESASGDLPSRDLYCVDLLPTPDFQDGSGTVEMRRVHSPFGVAVTRNGTHRFELVVSVEGLPEPTEIDNVTGYVAWVTTPGLTPIVKLGEVREGQPARGDVAFDKFLVLVTAEASVEMEEWAGQIVLRGTSPSSRMLPHDVPYLMSTPDSGHDNGEDVTEHRPGHTEASRLEWRMPPMHPQVPMPSGMGHLRPSVQPFLPSPEPGEVADPVNGEIVESRPAEILRLADGDTLELTSHRVQRRLNGQSFTMYGYNGQVPGPLIRVDQDATIVVIAHNKTSLPTAVHWHGIRLDNRFDGAPGVTQEEIPPGESFTYEVHLPDAGLYWYHPHVREDIKQALGLYGNLRVDPPDSNESNPVHREEVWMLDDLLVGDDGLVPYGLEAPTHALMGRFGNVLLVNGEPRADLDVDRGEVVRFLLTNVASTRTFNLSFGDAPIKVIASDLSRFEREEWVESVVIAPAERYVVEIRFDEPGEVAIENRVRGIDHTYGNYFQEADTLGVVHVSEQPAEDLAVDFNRLRSHPEIEEEIEALRPHFDRPPDHELVFSMKARNLPFPMRPLMRLDSTFFNPVEWSGTMPMMNWASTANEVEWILRDPETGRENMDIDWRFRVGDLVRLQLRNEREVLHGMQHPFHIHGQRFLVLSMNGVPNENLVWKDTFLLPIGWTAELLVEMSNPGDWMFHCHIAEHLGSGMMGVFHVESGGTQED